ncbi:MAG: vanadium-dependent haloperoxidase [Verrucomicrobiota bacterium JB023]|nr:vanadium-dependent haloperoxidase [Verrucomicrobiota bacterium JB023]
MKRLSLTLALSALAYGPVQGETIARQWNEENLAAIRIAFPDPPVHARNLFHVSVAMYDAWAAYDEMAVGYVHREAASPENGMSLEDARREAVSHAAYRVLTSRYVDNRHPKTPSSAGTTAQLSFDALMGDLGYDIANETVTGDSPAAVGNRVAEAVLDFAASDGSREANGYNDPSYSPVNDPLIFKNTSSISMTDPNRWQPLAFDFRVTQNGIIADSVQTFVGSHWGGVRPFALHRENDESLLYLDPGTPPLLGGEDEDEFIENNIEVIRFSSWLDPDAGTIIDCSPGSIGNNTLGENDGTGHSINPVTQAPYAVNSVNLADFGRVVAEFWADGPDSETPPGHWNSLANAVVDHPDFEPRFGGTGPLLDDLEWDVKMYFALNAAVHDVAVAVWGCKRHYDYVRPVCSIRYLGYNNLFPEVPGLIETITEESSAPGERHEHLDYYIGRTAIYAWGGETGDPENEYAGSEWMLAQMWIPYQRDTFVTPAFAGYTSGHSGFSRAAAEVLTAMTGSPFFPGGLATHTVPAGSLEFEAGPSQDVTLEWATYYDAADQAGLSRLYGGIHVAADDGPGRLIGAACGQDVWQLANQYYDGSILDKAVGVELAFDEEGQPVLNWNQERGLFYQVFESNDLGSFTAVDAASRAGEDAASLQLSIEDRKFYQVRQLAD